MLRKFMASVLVMSTLNNVSAQDSTQKSNLAVTGSADLYYKYDFGESKFNNRTSFTNSHNTFELGMASVKLDYKTAKTEVVADFGFGKRAHEFSYNDTGILAAIKQLYISYSANSWLKFTAGSWATHVGYEVLDAYANRNYSMSYMFTNGPFFHTGVKAEAAFGKSGLMVGVVNPLDFKYVPDGRLNRKNFIAQYSFSPSDNFKAYLNYAGGQYVDTSKTNQFDLVILSKLGSKFGIGANGTINITKGYLGNKVYDKNKSWYGGALYLNFDPTSKFGLTLREEYFNDDNKLKVFASQVMGGNVFASTLSFNLRTDNLLFIPEFRLDNASSNIFINSKGEGSKTAANFLLAVVYQF